MKTAPERPPCLMRAVAPSASVDHLVGSGRPKGGGCSVFEVQEGGIIFVDEIDKLAVQEARGGGGWNVKKGEGVQKELLALLEGTSVRTRHGLVSTRHVLFVCAGAFHQAPPARGYNPRGLAPPAHTASWLAPLPLLPCDRPSLRTCCPSCRDGCPCGWRSSPWARASSGASYKTPASICSCSSASCSPRRWPPPPLFSLRPSPVTSLTTPTLLLTPPHPSAGPLGRRAGLHARWHRRSRRARRPPQRERREHRRAPAAHRRVQGARVGLLQRAPHRQGGGPHGQDRCRLREAALGRSGYDHGRAKVYFVSNGSRVRCLY